MTVKGTYPKSEHGNFEVVDSIGVPHPYCLTPKHVAVASDHHSGILNEAAIKHAEELGACCDICRKNKEYRSYDQHEQALLVSCHLDFQQNPQAEQELKAYLLQIKDEAERNHYAGFAFQRADTR